MTWVQNLLDDENIFPTRSSTSLPLLASEPSLTHCFRSRILSQLPLHNQTRLPSTPTRIRPSVLLALPSDPAPPIRATLQLPLRAFPGIRQGIRTLGREGCQGSCQRASWCRVAMGEVEGDGYPRVMTTCRVGDSPKRRALTSESTGCELCGAETCGLDGSLASRLLRNCGCIGFALYQYHELDLDQSQSFSSIPMHADSVFHVQNIMNIAFLLAVRYAAGHAARSSS